MTYNIFFSGCFFCIMLTFYACKKNPGDLEPQNCRVISIATTGGTTYTTTYNYNPRGYISSESTDLGGTFEIKYTRDNRELLLSSKSYYNGEWVSQEKYDYSNGQISKVEIFDTTNVPIGIHNIKYNIAGLITKFTNEYGDPNYDDINLYEYNALGVQTKHTNTNMAGKIKFYEVTKPIGIPQKASEIYLLEHGIPYQMAFGYPFSVADAGVGSTIEAYGPDASGSIVLQSTLKIKIRTANMRGYTQHVEYADPTDAVVQTVTYSFYKCH